MIRMALLVKGLTLPIGACVVLHATSHNLHPVHLSRSTLILIEMFTPAVGVLIEEFHHPGSIHEERNIFVASP